jgi:hypothetical protein
VPKSPFGSDSSFGTVPHILSNLTPNNFLMVFVDIFVTDKEKLVTKPIFTLLETPILKLKVGTVETFLTWLKI